MSVSPEVQAKQIVDALKGRQDGWAWAEHIIASAIRQAEDAALERAAEICDDDQGMWEDRYTADGYDSFWRAGKSLLDAATEIRTLKSKQEI